MVELKVDKEREKWTGLTEFTKQTDILVRARHPEKGYGAFDIANLDRESLIAWLKDFGAAEGVDRSRRAISTCLHLLGHEMLKEEE